MSIKINIDKLDWDQRQKINSDLKITIPGVVSKYIFPHNIVNDDIFIPFSYAIKELNLKRPLRNKYPAMNLKFEGTLRDEQSIVKKEAIDILSETGSVIISMYTGGGKTITSISIACDIKLKTLIIVNKIVLIKQWEDSILQFCPKARIQKLITKSKFDDSCDFYIMNATNIPKMGVKFFEKIGLIIGDEVHLLVAESLVKSFLNISPRYLIALSATAYRYDDLGGLLPLFFGRRSIIREMNREHIVYKVETGIIIENEIIAETGKINWGAVLKKQSSNTDRNDLIVKIIKYFSERVFIVMCKRVEQAKYIYNKLKEAGESVDNLIGSKQTFDRECRCLVSIQTKTGTGFDWPKVNTLLLATDTSSYFIQSLGRIFRTKDTIPMVFDIVDANFVLVNHYKQRRDVYEKVGGKIKLFNRSFPDFFNL